MIEEKEFNFARALKDIRESRSMTQKDLGEKLDIDPNRISNWELGYSMPHLAVFREVCIALNCPPGDLLALSPVLLSGDEYTLIKGFRSLNEAGRHTMLAVLESQLAVRKKSDK